MPVTQIGYNDADGTNIGKDANALVAFHGASPVDQAATVAAVSTSAPTQTSPFGFSASAQPIALIAAVNSILACLKEKGLMSNT